MFTQAEAASKAGSARWDLKRANSAYKAWAGSSRKMSAKEDAGDDFIYEGWAIAPRSKQRFMARAKNDQGNQLLVIFSVIAALSLLVKFALAS